MTKCSFSEGNLYYRQGEYTKALNSYTQSVIELPSFKYSYTNFSFAAMRSNVRADDIHLLLRSMYSFPIDLENDYALIKKSKLVNGKWYREEYREFLPKGVDPILHYMVIGWRLGFNPCKRFDTTFYLQNYALDVNQNPLVHYLKEGKRKGYKIKGAESNLTNNLSVQLWNGHSISALKELEKVYKDTDSKEESRWWAMWHTARWLYFCGEIEKALEFACEMQGLVAANKSRKETVYLSFFCLMSLGRPKDAYQVLKAYVDLHPKDADAHFALSNSLDRDIDRLEMINHALSIHGFSKIRIKDETKPLSIANVRGEPLPVIKGSKKVSIIMPIYSAGEQVRIAIESLLEQSYDNIEIIAVDDCSPDNTFEILKALEKEDPRIKAIQPPVNGGAYAARNFGLKFATGELLTTHDSDDWSHPQKIATQVAFLETHPEVKGCSAHWIRAQQNLLFTQNWRPNNCLTHWSQSSFMFHRDVLDTIGEWDHVRIGGDTEYIWRMQAHYGKKAFAKIFDDTPLAFALDEESSLTRTKATHVRTVYFGLRHIYREICAWWHASNEKLKINDAKKNRAFPAPRSMFERSDDPLKFDIVIAGDFSRLEDCKKVVKHLATNPKQKVALFHWPSFHKAPESLCTLYFEQLEQGKVEPVVMGQIVECNEYRITDKSLIDYPLDGYPDFIGFKMWGVI
ncbi:glycosyltransferase family A protein [Nitrincola alkalisediminis]|uniref:glycosyltransferase family A protein n=1 Tax=Nitrincola alkalisediminis TaxID=1366656 RepID=UPI001875BB17|nr:glycosyltransferase family A protein [Nitrincola alkalisediminis]